MRVWMTAGILLTSCGDDSLRVCRRSWLEEDWYSPMPELCAWLSKS